MGDVLERPAQLLDGHVLLGHAVVGGAVSKERCCAYLISIRRLQLVFLPHDSLRARPDGLEVLVPLEDGEPRVAHLDGVKVRGLG